MNFPTNLCLGRRPSPKERRTVNLQSYALADLSTPPPSRLWHEGISDWGVMGNNQYGNCVIVTAAHALLSWRANSLGDGHRISDSAVIELSRTMGALNGYNIYNRLEYWRRIGMWADLLWSYAEVPMDNLEMLRVAINEFGLVDVGVNLPRAWKGSDLWNLGYGPSYRPGSWGGHSVPLVGYDEKYFYTVTWGEVVPIELEAIPAYFDEGYALINSNWLALDGVTPSGFDLRALHADQRQLAS